MNLCVFLLLFIFVQVNYATVNRLNDEEYELMPSLVNLDPFEKCLRPPGGRYCTAYANFVADGPSPLLTQMQKYSEHTAAHFNHTRALFGVCLTSNCNQFYDKTTADLRRALEACLNHSLWEEYNLKVRVEEDVSCHEHNEKTMRIGVVDIVVACILLALVVCNAVGSLFDVFWRNKNSGPVAQFLLCFSIPGNWKKLTAKPGEGERSFNGINGIRAISMMMVIVAHAVLPSTVVCENPKFIEDKYDFLPIHLLLNGTLIMQTFLFISAFLMTFTSQVHAEKHAVTWRMLPSWILKRWLRLTPPYALVLAVTATWIRYIGSGPIWKNVVVSEAVDCRRDWWKHLLYINNYEDDSLCMLQAWYLAADTQLYCLGVVIFVFCRSPRARKVVLPALFTIGLIIPALHTYYQDLDATLIVSPSAIIGFFRTERTFNEVYKRGHTNISSYIIGMAFGYLVYYLQKNNFDITKYRRWRLVYWLLFPLALTFPALCKVFYDEGPRPSVYLRALIAACIKPAFGLTIALLILGMILKMEKCYRDILEWPGWTCPGRVSYSAYLLHVTFIRVIAGVKDHPVRATILQLVESILFIVVLTYFAACFFWLTVEAPLYQLVKTCLEPSPRREAKNEGDPGTTQKIDTKL